MTVLRRFPARLLLLELLLLLLALLFLYPFYLIAINSFKSFDQIMLDTIGWPDRISWENYAKAWVATNFPRVLLNSTLITVLSLAGLVVIASMAAWRLTRYPGRWSHLLFLLFVSAMIIPFQSIMLPLVEVGKRLGLMDSIAGLVFMYFGFCISLSVFLFSGFVKSIPSEVEEAGYIDGCTTHTLYWKIVFPLLKPVTATVLILNGLHIWNDFLMPLLMLRSKELHTIPIATFSFFSQYERRWDMALPMLVMSLMPMLVFFLFTQKYMIKGVMSGSIKG